METRRDVFQAIADPTRREIINLIAHRSLNLNTIAENFDVTRQAISLHIKILTECGLVNVKKQGRERYCEARLEKLNEVAAWVDQYKVFWNNKLDALGRFLDEQSQSDSNKDQTKKT
ncbi:Transcriptional regulator, ArsR family [Fulvivirga imtechensis AK7]|uniref:Transcriptional regulator, ArsR family n=1 Tax=Fulvivirga imtechensis AK7 TaxID=1237149 RepID=L8JL94_9BACT|nr:metalloregulator ArsR/SmtB family transcription factor [Fulvivirga imtechensis]ELR69013.1 Transcriptional regulator, ArsR family [Fulvivirga imtechensis AK7]